MLITMTLERILASFPHLTTSTEDFVLSQNKIDRKWQLVTNVILDYETQRQHRLTIIDVTTKDSVAEVQVDVANVNDNLPVFNQTRYSFGLLAGQRRFSTVGKVSATDADGDKVVYSLAKTYPCCIITPQTGEIIIVDLIQFPTFLSVLAHEKDSKLR